MSLDIYEYDQVDPVSVLNLNLTALNFALTPEYAAHIRRTDPRPFPFFAIYAAERGQAVGQVGVFRLPMVSASGQEAVGGVWAVCTHPNRSGQGIASQLLAEAHRRMRAAGLRYSTLGTTRSRGAYRLYQRLGYVDTQVLGTALAGWETAHQPTRLRAVPAGDEGHARIERLFCRIAGYYLGFAWRQSPFALLWERTQPEELWVLKDGKQELGYAITRLDGAMLHFRSLLLLPEVDIAEAVAAVATKIKSAFVNVSVHRPVDINNLRQAGYRVAQPDWQAFMVKALTPDASLEDAWQRFGIGSDRFAVSWLDLT